MASYKRWVKRGFDGNLMKWTDDGQQVEGIWRGTRAGKYGDLGMVDTGTGEGTGPGTVVTFPIHTALGFLIEGLRIGDEIKIIYTGKIVNPKSGMEFKSFELYVATEGEEVADATVAGDDPGPSDDDLPF